MLATKKTPRLGRGLSSLLATPVAVDPAEVESAPKATSPPASDELPKPTPAQDDQAADETSDEVFHVKHLSVEQIHPNRYQPRQYFDEQSLKELADSIREQGVMQPIVVRPSPEGFELIAGERRWRAGQLAELAVLPAIVRDIDDQQAAQWALVENLQREDLNPLEKAEAFHALTTKFDLTHEEVAQKVGLSRASVTNLLRLLSLERTVQQAVGDGNLLMGHARALAGLSDLEAQALLAGQAMREGWSVRQVEQEVKQLANDQGSAARSPSRSSSGGSSLMQDLSRQLTEQLGTKVQVKRGRKQHTGTISIEFFGLDQFDALLERMQVEVE